MKYLKTFESHSQSTNIYDIDLNEILPDELTIQEYGIHTFKRGNIMKNADMFQITYVNVKNEWGYSDTLEIDLYTVQDATTGGIRFDIDISVGDFIVSEFSLEPPNKIKVIEHMTYRTKFCKDCPIFAFTDESIEKLTKFLNHFEGMQVNPYDLRFLNSKDDWESN